MTGWRVGYMQWVIRNCAAMSRVTGQATSNLALYLNTQPIEALTGPQDSVNHAPSFWKNVWIHLSSLVPSSGFGVVKPRELYLFPNVKKAMEMKGWYTGNNSIYNSYLLVWPWLGAEFWAPKMSSVSPLGWEDPMGFAVWYWTTPHVQDR